MGEVLRRFRAAKINTPILILSGLVARTRRSRASATVPMITSQAVQQRRADQRIRAIVRRSKGHSESIIRTGKLTVNLDTRAVKWMASRCTSLRKAGIIGAALPA